MNESDLKAPPRWGEDPLSEYLLKNRRNVFSVFVHGKGRYRSFQDILRVFNKTTTSHVDSTDEWYQAILIGRTSGAFLGAAHLALAGQSNEAFTLTRSMIEWAAYSCLFAFSPKHLAIWIDRDMNEEARRLARREITWASARERIPDQGDLRARSAQLYEETIDYGAHPNQAAAFNGLRIEKRESQPGAVMTVVTTSGDPAEKEALLKFVAVAGVTSLELLRAGLPPCLQ